VSTTPVDTSAGIDWDDTTALNAGLITREDLALKKKLQGIWVPIANDEDVFEGNQDFEQDERIASELQPKEINGSKMKHVPVYFRLPENEVRRRVFPYITIDFLSLERDPEREHRGVVYWNDPPQYYNPPGLPLSGNATSADWPIPMTITWQVTAWSRFNRHDRQIMQALFVALQPRFGFLEMGPVDGLPDDASVRRLNLESGPTNGDTRDENGKRVFRKMYTVACSSELMESQFVALQQARSVDISVTQTD
jgi:hypothetical protein